MSTDRPSLSIRLLCCLLAGTGSLIASQATDLEAQGGPPAGMQRAEVVTRTTMGRVNGSRLIKYTTLGAAGGAGMAMGYWALSDQGMRGNSCEPLNCALPYLTITGALAGLFLARELEAQRIALTPREGAIAKFATTEIALITPPTWVEANDSLLFVAGDSGVQVISSRNAKPSAVARRAAGLRAVRQVVLVPERNVLSIGTATALWETPVMTGAARRVGDGGISALASNARSVLSASGDMVRLQRGIEGESAITDSLRVGATVGAAAWDARDQHWWVATDSSLIRVTQSASGLTLGAKLSIPAGARGLTIGANYVVVVLGDAGIVAFPRASLSSADAGGVISPLRLVGEPRFAFDADFLGDTLYVAGGVDGVFRVALSPDARIIDSSRQFPFATLIRNQGGQIWVGDRGRQEMVRIDR
ncbi:MAG: hypothetical protein IBJ03_00525 [Gemmatimonadaceae bacterium]|nr:hypothetical protein [Gemmatimonadaceae bacterium]